MSNEEDIPDREVVAALAEKMEAFAASLGDRERDVLAAVLQGGDDELADVSGFAAGSPLEQKLGLRASKPVISGVSTKLFPSIRYEGPVRLKTTDATL